MPSIVEFLSGVTNQGTMRDYQHASRLYLDDVYALAPKNSWIYYVVFSINPRAISESQWKEQSRDQEAGMLVKSINLPKFTIQTETLNQYNRKTNIQTKIVYNPISMSFHDDTSNVTNSLWVNYYRYYYRDTWWGQDITGGNITEKNKSRGFQNQWKYTPEPNLPSPDGRAPGLNGKFGLNNDQSVPFFNAITIYQLNQKRFTSYVLVNPLITSWEHDSLEQSSNKFAESKMSVAYEAVFYGEGQVKKENMSGFGTFHYDRTPSPLSIGGGGTSTLFGPGGIVAGAGEIFGDTKGLLSGADSKGSILGTIGLGIKGANLVKNYENISKATLKAEGQSILSSAISGALRGSSGGLSGLFQGGIGALSKSLGFGPGVGTMLVGSNFSIKTNATAPTSESVAAIIDENTDTTLEGRASAQASGFTLSGQGVYDAIYSDNKLDRFKIEEQIDAQTALITENANAIQANTKIKEQLDTQVEAALATEGPVAAARVRAEFARNGYVDPLALTAKQNILNANITELSKLNSGLDNATAANLGTQSFPIDRSALPKYSAAQDSQAANVVVTPVTTPSITVNPIPPQQRN